jgi:Ca-activated chloride channel family protein
MSPRRLVLLAAVLLPLAALSSASAQSQPSRKPPQPTGPTLSASQRVMAGSPLSVLTTRAPEGARLAIARPADPAGSAIVVVPLGARPSASLPTPGEAGAYELRLTRDRDGAPVILLRQPLVTTPPEATLAAPARIGRGQALPVRGIGPNGERDRVVLVPAGAAPDAQGPSFFPQENVEATLDGPDQPGAYELRYVMDAPVSGLRVLATRAVSVE